VKDGSAWGFCTSCFHFVHIGRMRWHRLIRCWCHRIQRLPLGLNRSEPSAETVFTSGP
jgi:hypothetical protein